MKRFFSLVLFSFLISFSLASCRKNRDVIVFNESDAVSLNPEYEWALVTSPFTACYQDCDYASLVVTHFRKGEIHQVTGYQKVIVDEREELWYAFEEGWVSALSLQVFSNRLKAENAAGKL